MKPYTLKLFLFLLFIALSACDNLPTKSDDEVTAPSKPVSEKQATLTEEAERLISLAEDSDTDAEQLKYRSQAISVYIQANEIDRAKQQLAFFKDKSDPTATDLAQLQIVTAKIALAEKNSTQANQIISEIKPVSREQQIQFYELKADYDYLIGNYMFAIDRRVQLSNYIVDAEAKNKNNKKIWAALSGMPTIQLNNQQTNKPTIEGWLDLAKVMRNAQQNISQLEDTLLDWATRYPTHPVDDTFLHELIANYQSDTPGAKHIAVFLPMQGNTSAVAATIKNGLLSAYYQDSTSAEKPTINFYDTSNDELTFTQLYQQAIDDGATNVIGPIDKIVINRLTQERELDIPVLSLNYSENTLNHTDNLYQFGLAPEDEARQVAELAIAQEKFRAAVFYADSEWGNRLNQAFTQHYEYLGGKVLTHKDYATNTNDYRRPIRQLLNLDQSSIRIRKVENTISRNTQSTPYRRQDIDMIFLAATHHSARSIMPAFKFHHAGDIPVYSTSHVYSGKVDRELNRDLNGIIFCDLPWVLQNNSPLAKTFSQNWPHQENYTRLFAFGIDAYHLIYNIDYLENNDYASYDGQTGNMQLDDYNRIIRKSLWATFKNGRAVYFEPVINPQENDSETKNSN